MSKIITFLSQSGNNIEIIPIENKYPTGKLTLTETSISAGDLKVFENTNVPDDFSKHRAVKVYVNGTYKSSIYYDTHVTNRVPFFVPATQSNITTLTGNTCNSLNVYFKPNSYFFGGKYSRIYFVYAVNISGGVEQTNYVNYYDLESKTYGTPVNWVAPGYSGSDNHHPAPIIVTNDGHILIAYDDITTSHNRGLIVKRSQNPEDISSYSIALDMSMDGANYIFSAYPWFKKFKNGKIMLGWRGNINSTGEYYICARVSTDNGQTWGSPFIIADEAQGVYDPVMYHTIASSPESGKLGILAIARNGSGGKMQKVYWIESEDGQTFTNAEGTYSRNVVADGKIPAADLETYFFIDEVDSFSNGKDYVTFMDAAFAPDGTPVFAYMKYTYIDTNNKWRDAWINSYKDGAWRKYKMNDLWADTLTSSLYGNLIVYNYNTYDYIFSHREASNKDDVWIARTYDAGQTWIKLGRIGYDEDGYTFGYKQITLNYLDLPFFILAFMANDGTSKHIAHKVFKR